MLNLNKNRMVFILSVMLSAFASGTMVHAQTDSSQYSLQIASIVHPLPDEPVTPLNALVIIQINELYAGENFYYSIYLDDQPVTARWDPEARTFSYFPAKMLLGGEHTIRVNMSTLDVVKEALVSEGTFTVANPLEPARTMTPTWDNGIFSLGRVQVTTPLASPVISQISQVSRISDIFSLNGKVSLNVAYSSIDGLGASLRQEPANTTLLDLYGRGMSDLNNFDFRFYVSTDETVFSQPRNRYLFNIARDIYGFAVGDNTPRFNENFLYGLRLRGVYGWGKLGPLTFYATEGQARAETVSRYLPDGTILSRGLGERRLMSGRIGIWEDTDFSLGYNYLTGVERQGDDPLTGNPGTNNVHSLDFLWKFDDDNGQLQGDWTQADFDYDDPEEADIKNALAQSVEATYSLPGHTIVGKWSMIEPGFISLGRSNTQVDRESWGIEDRLNIDRGTLTGRLFYETFWNNVTGTLPSTTTTDRYGGQVRYRLSRTGPTLTLAFSRQDRSNSLADGTSGRIDDSMKIFSLGIGHNFELWGGRHNLQADYRTMSRDNSVSSSSDSDQEMITVRLSSRWTNGFQMDLLYGGTDNEYSGRDQFTETNRLSARMSYTPQNDPFSIWARYEDVDSDGDIASFNSERETFELGMKWNLGTDMILEASLMVVDFNDYNDDARNLNEQTFKVILTHILN